MNQRPRFRVTGKVLTVILSGFLAAWADTADALAPTLGTEYSFAILPNGWRPVGADRKASLFAIETGHYGFSLDLGDLTRAGAALLSGTGKGYEAAVAGDPDFLQRLPSGELCLSLETEGRVYRARTSVAATSPDPTRMKNARLWESGRLVQHVDFQDLAFADDQGVPLGCSASLDVVAWPRTLTLNLNLAPDYRFVDGPGPGVVGNGWTAIEKPWDLTPIGALEGEAFTVESWVLVPAKYAGTDVGWLLCKNRNEWEKGNVGFQFSAGSVNARINLVGGAQNDHRLDMKRGAFRADQWNHLAVTHDGKSIAFYINGTLQSQKAVNQKWTGGAGILRLGGRGDSGYRVRACFDSVRVWNRALPETELRTHGVDPILRGSREGLGFEENFDHGTAVPVPAWKDAVIRVEMKGGALSGKAERRVEGKWERGAVNGVSLTMHAAPVPGVPEVRVRTMAGQGIDTRWDDTKACVVARVTNMARTFQAGYVEIRDYDEFLIEVDSSGKTPSRVPFLLDLRKPANITGLCPILCDGEGKPTGIPVQLSKNWHHGEMGEYLMAYAMLPTGSGTTRYRLRIAYGFYGGVPSASHAQLSLIGYGGNGRWDQLAIGCWGETICFDMDMSLVPVAIADVRLLMVRNGAEGKKWNWTGADWGGDWLDLDLGEGKKAAFRDVKTAYLAHGPCLTEAVHQGFYGDAREVGFQSRVRTLRTDDYARTFQKLSYTFRGEVPRDRVKFFRAGGGPGFVTPSVAWGDGKGLTMERKVEGPFKEGAVFQDALALNGEGPWWIAFPDQARVGKKEGGTGSRSVIIRSYSARLGGKTYDHPSIMLKADKVSPQGPDLNLYLVPPEGVSTLKPGDTVEMDLEWFTLPLVADDYYGPNEAFRSHLVAKPKSWETTWREVKGNRLEVTAKGGRVVESYPVIIQAEKPLVEVTIKGGVGYVPIRFDGLKSIGEAKLFRVVQGKELPLGQDDGGRSNRWPRQGGRNEAIGQEMNGNDSWQTDFDAATGTYRMTFNVPLDGVAESTWVFRVKP